MADTKQYTVAPVNSVCIIQVSIHRTSQLKRGEGCKENYTTSNKATVHLVKQSASRYRFASTEGYTNSERFVKMSQSEERSFRSSSAVVPHLVSNDLTPFLQEGHQWSTPKAVALNLKAFLSKGESGNITPDEVTDADAAAGPSIVKERIIVPRDDDDAGSGGPAMERRASFSQRRSSFTGRRQSSGGVVTFEKQIHVLMGCNDIVDLTKKESKHNVLKNSCVDSDGVPLPLARRRSGMGLGLGLDVVDMVKNGIRSREQVPPMARVVSSSDNVLI